MSENKVVKMGHQITDEEWDALSKIIGCEIPMNVKTFRLTVDVAEPVRYELHCMSMREKTEKDEELEAFQKRRWERLQMEEENAKKKRKKWLS